MNRPTILLVDADPQVASDLAATKTNLVDVLLEPEMKGAQIKIADMGIFLSAICLNTKICDSNVVPLVRFAKMHRPASPIYLMADQADMVPTPEFQDGLHVQKCFVKPLNLTELINSIFPYTYFEMGKLMELAKSDHAQADTTVDKNDEEMHPISARDFISGSKSFFDVFVHLSSGKYLKILKAGDQFDASRVKSYIEKGVTHFYMKREVQELFLQYCDKITESVLARTDASDEMKINQVMNFGKETSDFLVDRGFNEMTIQAANQFVKHAYGLTAKLKPSVLDGFLENISHREHGTGTVMILSLLIQQMGFEDKKVIEVIALAGLCHDIGLIKMPEQFQCESEQKLTKDELVEFEKHPIIGAELIKGIRRINALVPQVVLQHHERRTRNGFPHKLGPGAISPVAEMVGIADTFNQLIRRASKDNSIDPIHEIVQHHFNGFSAQVSEAFRKVFCDSKA